MFLVEEHVSSCLRCGEVDQSVFTPLFAEAVEVIHILAGPACLHKS